MTTRSTPTPPKQGSPPASMDPPATPGSKSAITPALPLTPGAAVRQRTLPPATPGHSIISPFPPRTPRTPGGTVTSCTSDKDLFSFVTVHTAKCTECDDRNKATMRRCPGCTFQVCKPCYERREKEGRGLMHGNAMSNPATPTTQRTVRKKPLPSTPGGRSGLGVKAEVKKEGVATKTEGEGSEKKKVDEGKNKAKAKATPVPRMPTGKKRAARKKPRIEDSTSDESSDDDFESDLTSPTPSKRRRTTPATSTRRGSNSSSTDTSPNHPDSDGRRPSSLNWNNLYKGVLADETLQKYCVDKYDQPFLSRRIEYHIENPAMRNPHPEKARPTAEKIQENIQEKTRQKIDRRRLAQQSLQDMIFDGLEAKREQAQEKAYQQTVRVFVETQAAKHRDDVAMDEDENEALMSTLKDAARKWGNQTHNKLSLATQKLLKRGLDMQLDKIDEAYTAELANLLDDCAARKLQELAQDSAPSTTTSPSHATDATQPVHGAQERAFEQL